MNPREAPKRSLLYSPASRIDRVRKALEAAHADVVVADLEDGTAPGDRPGARKDVQTLLATPPPTRSLLAVRINAWPSDAAQEDLAAVARAPPPVLVVPKVESAKDLLGLVQALAARAIPSRIFAQIETARGLLHGEVIAAAERVDALVFGAEDYAANVGATRTPEGLEVLYARSRVVACAAAAGIEAIDQIWADFKDTAGLERDAKFGAGLGFAGKQLIHPQQIAPTHDAFRPSPRELDRAQRIVAAAERAGGGVVVVDDRMIDQPLVAQARRLLARGRLPA